ncbi:MAG: relaxase/mobilization nuclease domain-containing protein [Rhodospirillales bacterium]|nr:relaxase/mobilization nuclease domain-containing protein [Rhodospirillales bacterium]
MAVPFDEEDWELGKLGRFSDADERLVRRVMGPWLLKPRRSRLSQNPQGSSTRPKLTERQAQVLMSRGNTVALGINYTPRRQAIVKAGFCPKSRRGAINQILYVTRCRPQDLKDPQYKAMPIWDGFGQPVPHEDILSIAEKWDLPCDDDNLSKKARTHLERGEMDAFHALSGRERLWNILTWHFILSIEENDDELFQQFRVAVRKTVDAAFTAEGRPSIWAIHGDDTEHLHAHIIVKAKSDFGGRIHSNIRGDYLHYLRETFAGNLRSVGLNYEATRRVDRKSLRDEIMAGQAFLHDEQKPWREDDGVGDIYAKLPIWPQIYGPVAMESLERIEAMRRAVKIATQQLSGLEKVSRAAELLKEYLEQVPTQSSWWGRFLPRQKKKNVSDNLTKSEWDLLQHLERMYHDPRQALENFRLLASDGAFRDEEGKKVYPNRGLAVWTLHHRPELLGLTKAGAYQINEIGQLKLLLKQVRLWSLERLPMLEQNDNTFAEAIWRSKAEKDRTGALGELNILHSRIQKVWPGARLDRSIAEALRQAERIQIDNRMPPSEVSDREENSPANAVMRKPVSSASDGGGGGIKPLERPHQPSTQNTRKITRPKNPRGIER